MQLGTLALALDPPITTVRYAWSGPPALLAAAAFAWLEDSLLYYADVVDDAMPEQLRRRAVELAEARLAGAAAPPPWRAVAGNADHHTCTLQRMAGKLGYLVTRTTLATAHDVEACLALLHEAMSPPDGERLARALRDRLQRGAAFQDAIAPLVA